MPSPQHPAFFDKEQAASYDTRFAKLWPMRDLLHFLSLSALQHLPEDAHILSVGAGTGADIFGLAKQFPGWRFTAVEPAPAMLDICRQRAGEAGIASRCEFHEGYLDTLPAGERFHAATSILVSQFILPPADRTAFFRGIAERLLPGGILINADLSSDMNAPSWESIFGLWMRLIDSTGMPPEKIAEIRAAYGRDVAISPPAEIESIIHSAEFTPPVQFFQSVLIRGWQAARE